jgi:hypothetical protein
VIDREYRQDLIEQIVLDNLAIEQNAEPGKFFYLNRIADYRVELIMGDIEMMPQGDMNRNMTKDELLNHIESNRNMTPEEKLYARLFYEYKNDPKVNAMTDLELRAHREELIDIIRRGKVYVGVVDDILKERKPKGVQGFKRSVNIDETTTEAINAIKERQKRLSKTEKIQANLLKLYTSSGMNESEALELVRSQTRNTTILLETKAKDVADVIAEKKANASKIINPFEKKGE